MPKQIKDVTAQTTPATGDLVLIQQAADDANRKTTLQQIMTACPATSAAKGTVLQIPNIAAISGSVSNPPTQAQVQAIQDKLNAVIAAMISAGMMHS